MVMDDDPALRANRLALLSRLKALFDRIANLSVLS
jgi:glycyl-tRNA synthetase beta subunit